MKTETTYVLGTNNAAHPLGVRTLDGFFFLDVDDNTAIDVGDLVSVKYDPADQFARIVDIRAEA